MAESGENAGGFDGRVIRPGGSTAKSRQAALESVELANAGEWRGCGYEAL